jgi:glutaredoxin
MSRRHRRPIAAACGLLALLAAGAAPAQYKAVGPDGRITYTDRPTETTAQAVSVQPLRSAQQAAADAAPRPAVAAATAALPYELRQVAERFPVTLYTRPGCAVCDSGRSALRERGIPYAERTVGSDLDVQALQRIEGVLEVPLLRIGAQQLRGYAPAEWGSYLDAAGYPKTSRLPAGWRGWEPQPLAGERRQADAARVPPAPPAAPLPAEPARLPPALESAPPGIRF